MATGPNQRAVLHALVMSRGEILRDDLERVLPNGNLPRDRRQQAIRNALFQLRRLGLAIAEHGNPVTMSLDQPVARVDLWDFFAHVALERWEQAEALIARGQEPWLLDRGRNDDLWQRTLSEFARAKRAVVAARAVAHSRRHAIRETRERLLARGLVRGVGCEPPVGLLREQLQGACFPWRSLRPERADGERPLPQHVIGLLQGPPDAPPRHVVLVGAPGLGTALYGMATFLRLTDDDGACRRPILYVDAGAEGAQEGFGTDAWFERRLAEHRWDGSSRAIVIVPRADALLTGRDELRAILSRRLLREPDVLLCCGEALYATRLRYEDYGTDVLELRRWGAEAQRAFAVAVLGADGPLEAWRDADPHGVRARLCAVPLHLVHVLSLLGDDDPRARTGLAGAGLFEQLARVRLRVAGMAHAEDLLLRELGSLAHRFYVAARPDCPIEIEVEELREHLSRGASGGGAVLQAEAVADRTLLARGPEGAVLRFEDPAWAEYFVARHLVHTLRFRPAEVLAALSKPLSPRVMDLCEELARNAPAHHDEPTREALRFALREDGGAELLPERRALARERAARLLDVLEGAVV